MNFVNLNKLTLLILLVITALGCTGSGGGGARTNYVLPTDARLVTDGYVAGDLIVSARFVSEDQLEVTSASRHYTENGQNYVTPAAVSTFERDSSGLWHGTTSHTIPDRTDTLISSCPMTIWLGGWEFTPAAFIVRGGLTAQVKQPDGTVQPLPVLDGTPTGWCTGRFQPQWPVAISPSGHRLLAIGSEANSTYTRPDGSVQLPMAVLESN